MVQFADFSFLLVAMFVIVGLTNVITETIKLNIGSKPHPNIVCTVTAIALTVIALLAYCQIMAVALTWYLVVGAVVFGFVNAFVAMQNFDKLITLFKKSGIPTTNNKE